MPFIAMNGCDVQAITRITRTPRTQVLKVLKTESPLFEITKSLLNLLYNAVIVGSLPVSQTQKDYFDTNSQVVRSLLDQSKSIKWKKDILTRNPALIINIASLCPIVAGSSSRKSALTN